MDRANWWEERWEKDSGGEKKNVGRMHGTRDPMLQGKIMRKFSRLTSEDMETYGFKTPRFVCTWPRSLAEDLVAIYSIR